MVLLEVPDGRRLGIGRGGRRPEPEDPGSLGDRGGAQCHVQLAGEGPPSRGVTQSSAGHWAVPTEAPEVSWCVKWHYSGPLTEVGRETR